MYNKLLNVQKNLKAPKGQTNTFGKYKYRSCEDILEAVKPLLAKEGLVLNLSDEIVQIGERYYVKATAILRDTEGKELNVTAYAREDDSKKGMDLSQVTGATSSYARKYALNGMFCIDDTKDADTDEFTRQAKKGKAESEVKYATAIEKKSLLATCEKNNIDINDILAKVGCTDKLTSEQYGKALVLVSEIIENKGDK